MHIQSTVPTEAERLTPEEVEAIRRRYADADGRLPDLQAHGAATLDDVAEAVGIPATEVGHQLDRIRAERALQPIAPARKDQRGLLILAGVLLAAAYPIHLLNPRKLTPEEELAKLQDRVAEMKARHKAHPVVHYPILTRVKTGPLPPRGFAVEFKGELTDTTIASGTTRGSMEWEPTRSALVEAAFNAYRAAVEAERKAPKPLHPVPVKNSPWGGNAIPGPHRLVWAVGTANAFPMNPIALDPEPGYSPAQWDEEVRRRIDLVVYGFMDGMRRSQASSLKLDPPQFGNEVMPPEGFSITYAGRQTMSINSAHAIVLPYDAAGVARKLEWAIRHQMWRDDEPPSFTTPEMQAAAAKKPSPALAKVTINGPAGDVTVELPLTASAHYPNAAAAARAADLILAEAVRRAAAPFASSGGSGAAGKVPPRSVFVPPVGKGGFSGKDRVQIVAGVGR